MIQKGTVNAKIIISVTNDVSAATLLKIYYRKPDGTTGSWTATLESSTSISYTTTTADDLDQAGIWTLQSYVEIGGWTGYGENTQQLEVGENAATVLTADMSNLTTIGHIKSVFALSVGTNHDTLLSRLVEQNSIYCGTYCNRKFKAQSYTAEDENTLYDGDGTSTLLLKNYPINSITSIHDDLDREYNTEDLIDSSDYTYYPDTGIVELDGLVFSRGKRNVKVIYNAGYTLYPTDLVNACEKLVMADYIEHVADVKVATSDEVIYKPDKLRKDARGILERYKRYA